MAIFPGAISTDSDLYIAVNQKTTQLTDNPLTDSATTANVVSTSGFPGVGFISIDAEIIHYTGITATSFTGLTRGADGTLAASHVQNSQVYHNVIAAHHNVLKDEIIAIETHLGINGANIVHIAGIETITGAKTFSTQTIHSNGLQTGSAIVSDTDNTDDIGTTAISFKDFYIKGDIKVGATVAIDFASSAAVSIRGTTTNDSAVTGFVGEYISSTATTASPGSAQYFDVTSISLTAGDWDVSMCMDSTNTADVTIYQGAISTTAGNSGAGTVIGDTRLSTLPPTAANESAIAIPSVRFNLASTTTIYLKGFFTFSGSTPSISGRISARRIR